MVYVEQPDLAIQNLDTLPALKVFYFMAIVNLPPPGHVTPPEIMA